MYRERERESLIGNYSLGPTDKLVYIRESSMSEATCDLRSILRKLNIAQRSGQRNSQSAVKLPLTFGASEDSPWIFLQVSNFQM